MKQVKHKRITKRFIFNIFVKEMSSVAIESFFFTYWLEMCSPTEICILGYIGHWIFFALIIIIRAHNTSSSSTTKKKIMTSSGLPDFNVYR